MRDREKQRAYALASYRRKRAATLAAIGQRTCSECGAPLPEESRLSRQFCSRKCTNQVSLRKRAAERIESARIRRARIRAADSPGVSGRDWQRLKARFDFCCAYCGQPAALTMDHVIPIAKGGRHAIGNILPACGSCNSSKRDDLLIYWRNGRAKARLTSAS